MLNPFLKVTTVEGGPQGLTEAAADERLARDGENRIARRVRDRVPVLVSAVVANPFVVPRAWRQHRSRPAVDALRGLVTTTATVRRRACVGAPPTVREVLVTDLVVGDLVLLETGDRVPADLRLVRVDDLRVDRPARAGETPRPMSGLDAGARCFAGSTVRSGSATAVVISTGANARFGALTPAAIVTACRACVRWVKPD